MSVEQGFENGNTQVRDLDEAFGNIVRAGLDAAYSDVTTATEEMTVPYGAFTEDVSKLDETRAPMASATGYTGPNAEESC